MFQVAIRWAVLGGLILLSSCSGESGGERNGGNLKKGDDVSPVGHWHGEAEGVSYERHFRADGTCSMRLDSPRSGESTWLGSWSQTDDVVVISERLQSAAVPLPPVESRYRIVGPDKLVGGPSSSQEHTLARGALPPPKDAGSPNQVAYSTLRPLRQVTFRDVASSIELTCQAMELWSKDAPEQDRASDLYDKAAELVAEGEARRCRFPCPRRLALTRQPLRASLIKQNDI